LRDVESMVVSVGSDELAFALQPSAQIVDYLGFHPKPSFRVEGACASGSMAVRTGWMTVASGLSDLVLVVGAEKMTEVPTPVVTEALGKGGDPIWEYPFGMTFPGYYALIARAHMARYGTTEEQLALVAVKNHRYANLNPYAHMHKEITVEDVLRSRPIAEPLKLLFPHLRRGGRCPFGLGGCRAGDLQGKRETPYLDCGARSRHRRPFHVRAGGSHDLVGHGGGRPAGVPYGRGGPH